MAPLGIAAGTVLVVAAVVAALRLLPAWREQTLGVTLATFLVYVGGLVFGTAGGRTTFGIEQALSSRYTTPALMAWAALKPSHAAAFERAIGALALELGVRDAARIGRIFPDAAWALAIAETPRERQWSVFGLAQWRDAHRAIGRPATPGTRSGAVCRGGIEDTEAIDGEPRYLRVRAGSSIRRTARRRPRARSSMRAAWCAAWCGPAIQVPRRAPRPVRRAPASSATCRPTRSARRSPSSTRSAAARAMRACRVCPPAVVPRRIRPRCPAAPAGSPRRTSGRASAGAGPASGAPRGPNGAPRTVGAFDAAYRRDEASSIALAPGWRREAGVPSAASGGTGQRGTIE